MKCSMGNLIFLTLTIFKNVNITIISWRLSPIQTLRKEEAEIYHHPFLLPMENSDTVQPKIGPDGWRYVKET